MKYIILITVADGQTYHRSSQCATDNSNSNVIRNQESGCAMDCVRRTKISNLTLVFNMSSSTVKRAAIIVNFYTRLLEMMFS